MRVGEQIYREHRSLVLADKSAEFYFRCFCSVSELLAAKQSNDPAITIDNNIIVSILTTFYQKKSRLLKIVDYI